MCSTVPQVQIENGEGPDWGERSKQSDVKREAHRGTEGPGMGGHGRGRCPADEGAATPGENTGEEGQVIVGRGRRMWGGTGRYGSRWVWEDGWVWRRAARRDCYFVIGKLDMRWLGTGDG